jgi:hypothetical protein
MPYGVNNIVILENENTTSFFARTVNRDVDIIKILHGINGDLTAVLQHTLL